MSLEKQVFIGALTSDDATAQHELGATREEYDATNGHRTFKYVEFDGGTGSIAGAAAQVVYYVAASYAGAKVTPDVSDSDLNGVAGVMHAAVTDGQFGWMQIGGKDTVATNGDDDISAFDALIGGGDGTCNSVAQDTAPTNRVLGWALADDVDGSNTVVANLTVGEY